MAGVLLGRYGWGMTQDKEGHREYWITHLVETTDTEDGPTQVMFTPGLPYIGAIWVPGNDTDAWATCHPNASITVHKGKDGNPHNFWLVKNNFSTKPLHRCQDESIEDPLLEPPRVSGSFVNQKKLISQDKDGNAIRSSSHERILGPSMEFDHALPTVSISMNKASLGLVSFAAMVNTVNNAPLWGLATRSIKLSNVSWERLVYGTCGFYYRETYQFDIDYSTFDRQVYDEGMMELKFQGDKTDQDDFERIKDENDDIVSSPRFLDGSGAQAAAPSKENAAQINVQYYTESNFLSLGIPTSF